MKLSIPLLALPALLAPLCHAAEGALTAFPARGYFLCYEALTEIDLPSLGTPDNPGERIALSYFRPRAGGAGPRAALLPSNFSCNLEGANCTGLERKLTVVTEDGLGVARLDRSVVDAAARGGRHQIAVTLPVGGQEVSASIWDLGLQRALRVSAQAERQVDWDAPAAGAVKIELGPGTDLDVSNARLRLETLLKRAIEALPERLKNFEDEAEAALDQLVTARPSVVGYLETARANRRSIAAQLERSRAAVAALEPQVGGGAAAPALREVFEDFRQKADAQAKSLAAAEEYAKGYEDILASLDRRIGAARVASARVTGAMRSVKASTRRAMRACASVPGLKLVAEDSDSLLAD
ncbi:MAG: hypothetical protein HY078_15970 [Elusimicrobia bacterium]|nr:hypothetical protein [Elusimicrobiota bacterium]